MDHRSASHLLIILALCLGTVSSATYNFTSITPLEKAILAYGSACSLDGVDVYFASSDGVSQGVYESFDGGATLNFTGGLGAIAESMLLMATAARDVGDGNISVVVGGLLGSAISFDGGHEWQKTDIPELVTQDVKFESSSGFYSLTGNILGQQGASLSSDGGHTFDLMKVDEDLLYLPYVRYGSYPSNSTFYLTVGGWDNEAQMMEINNNDNPKKHISSRISINKDDGKLTYDGKRKQQQPSSSSVTWTEVVKTSDGGVTWSIVYSDFQSQRYPNDISCYDENTCVFTMESGGEVPPQILSTTDGGKTWNTFVDRSGGESLMAVRMVGPTEVWVSGGGDVGRMYHSTDLVNWDSYTTDATTAIDIYSFALNSDQSVAFATGILRDEHCTMLKIEF